MLIWWNGLRPDLLIHRWKGFSQGLLSNSFVFQTRSLTPWLFHCIPFFFLSGENGPAFPFLCSIYWRKKKEKQQQWDVAFWSIWRLCGEKNGKLWLCKHMEKNELLMHLVSFIYILPSVPNGLPALWTPDDTAALCQGVFLEAELDYANISEWQIKMVN